MRTRKSERAKASRFVSAVVVTVAAAGCGGTGTGGGGTTECCHNPPPIMSFTGLEPGDRIRRDDGGMCHQFHAATSGETFVECPSALSSPGSIWRQGDVCSSMPDVDCPPPSEATCNPPPPMQIPCPTE